MQIFRRVQKLLRRTKKFTTITLQVVVESDNAITFFKRGFIMSMTNKEHELAHAIFDGVPNGPVVWTIDNPATASIAPSADGLSCDVVGLTAGSATLTVTDGVVSATGSVDVSAAMATSVTVTFDPAVPV